jgi:hypothetical protein
MATEPGQSGRYGTTEASLAPSSPFVGRWLIFALIAAVIVGMMAVGYVLVRDFRAASGVAPPGSLPSTAASSLAAGPTPMAQAAAVKQTVQAVERVAEQQGGLDQRLAAAEQRLTQLDLQAQAAAGNAARAESLLIAFATRRAVERGAELGYLADQLRLRFGDQWPNAVSSIIDFSRNPVRLDELTARLEGLGPQLDDSGEGPSWAALQRELGQLFVVRRETTPSPQPQRRMERARWALEQGRYKAAIDEVKGMPGASKAQAWIRDAERYATAMEALEVIETAAVLDQRGLRDGAGNPMRQVSSPLILN